MLTSVCASSYWQLRASGEGGGDDWSGGEEYESIDATGVEEEQGSGIDSGDVGATSGTLKAENIPDAQQQPNMVCKRAPAH